jgi:phosphohistidine swiveling domain-containing protein
MSLKFIFDRHDMYVYPWYISDLTVTRGIAKISGGHRVKECFATIKGDFLTMYYDYESTEQVGQYILDQLVVDRKFYQVAIKQIYRYSDELLNFCRSFEVIDVRNISDQKLISLYRQYIAGLINLRVWGWVPTILDGITRNFLTDYLLAEFKTHLSPLGKAGKISEYYAVLSSSEKKSEVQTEEIARLELLLKIAKHSKSKDIFNIIKQDNQLSLEKKYPAVYQLFSQHLKDYGWLTYAYSGPTMTLAHLFTMLNDQLKAGDLQNQRKKIIKHYQQIKQEKKSLSQSLKLSSKLVYLFSVSAEFMFIKDYRKGIYQQSYVAMDKVINEIARRLKLTPRAVKYLVLEEVKQALLAKKSKKYQSMAKLRTKKCCYHVKAGRIRVYEGKKCEQMIKRLIGSEIKQNSKQLAVTELSGKVAYPGKVIGIAKIILVASDVKKINPGEILVSSSTNPDLILAMKKAAAFVTDLGGIISHAAIVSREMKKPCIVGTKIATHAIKDGDRIEVNANLGIVRILK